MTSTNVIEVVMHSPVRISIPDWRITLTQSANKKGKFLFKNKYTIQTTEGCISSNNEQVSIQLMDPHTISKNKQTYTHIHIGLIQVHIHPCAHRGINGSVSLFLGDKRLVDFNQSFLNVPHSSEKNDPINFYPNFMVSMDEIDILHYLKLNVKFHDLGMKANRYPLAVSFRIYYKWKRGEINEQDKSYGPGLDVALRRTNMRSPVDMSPRVIKRSDIQITEGWTVKDEVSEEQERNSVRFVHVSASVVKFEFPNVVQ